MAEAILEARDLSKTYGQGKATVRVLRGLSLSLEAGEFAVLLGPSGSGKSTLLNVLGLMDQPDSGEVRFSGRAVGRLPEEQKARLRNEKLGFVFQFDSLLPEFTVLENVLMPVWIAHGQGRGVGGLARAEGLALELLAGLGLRGLRERFPAQISGGERQRVALCRALINEPAVVLADEPTGNLDKQNGELVFKDLKNLSVGRGVAVLLVTHNESASDYAHRVLHMLDGAIASKPEKEIGRAHV